MDRKEGPGDTGNAEFHHEHLNRLQQCRSALAGVDDDGAKIHPGMFDAGVISLARGDGTRRPPAEAIAAGVSALLDPQSCPLDDYLFLQSFEPLEQEISRVFLKGGIPSHAAENICIDCGTTRLFGAFLHCVAQPGDVFLAAPTFYHSLPDWCDRFGITLACVPTQAEDGFKLTVEALEAWYGTNVDTGLMPKPRGLFLFNPTQTGALYQPKELAALAEFVVESDLLVLADHVFSGTEFPGSEQASYLAAQPGMASRVVTVDGVSKSHNLANMRIGWACGPAHIIEAMRAYGVSTIISIPRLGMIMAHAALTVPSDYLVTNARECARRATIVTNALECWNTTISGSADLRSGLTQNFRLVHVPEAGHSLLITCNPLQGLRYAHGVIRNSVDVTRFFLSEAGVAVSPGYSSGLDDCEVRLCFGSVGLASTYLNSAAQEREAAAQAFGVSASSAVDPPDTHGSPSGGSVRGIAESQDPFKDGRDTIQTALMDRMLPAILRLIKSNSAPTAGRLRTQKQEGVV